MFVNKLNGPNQIILLKQNTFKLTQVHVEENKSKIKP